MKGGCIWPWSLAWPLVAASTPAPQHLVAKWAGVHRWRFCKDLPSISVIWAFGKCSFHCSIYFPCLHLFSSSPPLLLLWLLPMLLPLTWAFHCVHLWLLTAYDPLSCFARAQIHCQAVLALSSVRPCGCEYSASLKVSSILQSLQGSATELALRALA